MKLKKLAIIAFLAFLMQLNNILLFGGIDPLGILMEYLGSITGLYIVAYVIEKIWNRLRKSET